MSNQKQESLYTCSELLRASASFGVKPEVMAGAIKLNGKNKMTKHEAIVAINNFKKKEV